MKELDDPAHHNPKTLPIKKNFFTTTKAPPFIPNSYKQMTTHTTQPKNLTERKNFFTDTKAPPIYLQ